MFSWEKILHTVYCPIPLRHAEVPLSCLMAKLRHNPRLIRQRLSVTSENSDFCLFPCVWPSSILRCCSYPKRLSNFLFILAGQGALDPDCPKPASTHLSTVPTPLCKDKCSLKCAICYFLTKDSCPNSEICAEMDFLLQWAPLSFLFCDFAHLCQCTWFFTIIIQYGGCADGCFLFQGISFSIWSQSGPEDINEAWGQKSRYKKI